MDGIDPDSHKIIAKLEEEKIQYLYHFTCIENLPGFARENSLCSKQYQESIGRWPPPKPGGNDISHAQDRIKDNWDKIALNFTPQTPMVYHHKRGTHLCFLLISTEVAGWKDVIFTDTNSASSNHIRGTGFDGLESIRFEKVREPYIPADLEWKKYVQAEALVPKTIPMEFIQKVAFVSKASMQLGEHLWGNSPHPEFTIDMSVFEDIPDPNNPTIGFPHISSVILTDSIVNQANVHNRKRLVSRFKRGDVSRITAVLQISTYPGTKCKVKWAEGIESEIEFQQLAKKIWWPNISLTDLPDGRHRLEVTVNNILWAIKKYEVVS